MSSLEPNKLVNQVNECDTDTGPPTNRHALACSSEHSPNRQVPIAADTGSTGHYFPHDFICLSNPLLDTIQATNDPIHIHLPDGSRLQSTHTAQLHELPSKATMAHLFPGLADTALLSIGQLCDAGCQATFTKSTCIITLHGKTILEGERNHDTNNLWYIKALLLHSAYKVTTTNATTPPMLVAFAHAAFFSPTIASLERALANNYIINYPGLTSTTLKKYPPHSVATAKGHMTQTRQGIQ